MGLLLVAAGMRVGLAGPADVPPLPTLTVEDSALGYTYAGGGGLRYFVCRLKLDNPTDRPLSVRLADCALDVDGRPFQVSRTPQELFGYAFQAGARTRRFSELEWIPELAVPPRSSARTWLAFTHLPGPADIPRLKLRVPLERVELQTDINALHRERLALSVQRIGPRERLAVLTIRGTLDSISIGSLIEEWDRLSRSGVDRLVVTFDESAQEPAAPLAGWLQQSTEGVATSQTYPQFPAAAPGHPLMHIAQIPGRQDAPSPANPAHRRVHASTASAVAAALGPVFQTLPADEILAEIERGHPLSQAAALTTGASRLPDESIPLLKQLCEHKDPLLRRGAVISLGQFGRPEAVEALTRTAQEGPGELADVAVQCLAASRYGAAHQALRQLLDGRHAADPAIVVRTLAEYPRPEWSELLFDWAAPPEAQRPSAAPGPVRPAVSPAVRRAALEALGRLGHPQLPDLLNAGLRDPDRALQNSAFSLLCARYDAESQQLAIEFTLERLRHERPSGQMLQLIDRVRDPRVVPLLLKYVDRGDGERTAILHTLARVGGDQIDRELAARYGQLHPGEQAVALSNLAQLASPEVVPLARRALGSEQSVLFNSAVSALQLDGSERAVEALASALKSTTDMARTTALARALKDVGSPASRTALEQARWSADPSQREVVQRMLRDLLELSPGYHSFRQAEALAQNEDHRRAIPLYDMAIEVDPELAAAYSSRGHCRLRLNELGPAESDFRKAGELDPFDSMAVTGLGIVLVLRGDLPGGIKAVDEAAGRFEQDPLFAYNAACMYGRAVEAASRQTAPDGAVPDIAQLQRQALSRLEQSIKLGFQDFDWMLQDPDLESLRNLPEFRKLVPAGATEPGSDRGSGETGNSGQEQ
jgi:HEAT repeat protein